MLTVTGPTLLDFGLEKFAPLPAQPDLWVLDVESKKAAPFQATPFNETPAQVSPDSKWIAFTSNQRDNRTATADLSGDQRVPHRRRIPQLRRVASGLTIVVNWARR